MRLILKRHTVKASGYSAKPIPCPNWNKLRGEKGELVTKGNGRIGENGNACVYHTFTAFDPKAGSQDILVQSINKRKGLIEIVSTYGNKFIFETIE